MPMVSLKLMAGAARRMVVASARTTTAESRAVVCKEGPGWWGWSGGRTARGGVPAPPGVFFGILRGVVLSCVFGGSPHTSERARPFLLECKVEPNKRGTTCKTLHENKHRYGSSGQLIREQWRC